MEKYSILFADDHTLLRQGLISLTQAFSFIDKSNIYQAANGLEAVNLVKKRPARLNCYGCLYAGNEWLRSSRSD